MASSIVKSAAQNLGKLMVEEAKYLYDLKDKIESLQIELKWMACVLRDADNQQHKEEVICIWVSQVRDLAYDADDLIERYLHEVPLHRRDGTRNTLKWFSCILWTCNAWTLHNLGSDIDNLTLKMSELSKRLKRYGIKIIQPTRSLEYNNTIREERRTHPHTEEDPIGLEKDIQQVVDRLLKTEDKVVAISGTGGLGKTTLARKVFKHKDIKGHFNDNCAWVYVSKEFDSKTVFQEILRQLEKGNDNANKTTEQFAEEIHKLLQGNKCFVVVDDIWTVQAWERLKPAFDSIFKTASSSSSSKILLTTRTKDLVQHVDPNSGYLYPLEPLSEDDSWKLLKRKAFIGEVHGSSDDADMKKLGKEMLNHCGGLPIAIIALGGILSTKKTLSEWKDVQTNISSYLMGSMEARVFPILELSYNELPYYLKPCFLYLGIFPEDYEISSHKLYQLWGAEGFFVVEDEVKKKGGTTYDIGERFLNGLVQRSMILVRKCWPSGKIKTCQAHDVIRDMCLRKCEEVGFLSHIACKESGMVYELAPFSAEIEKLRRCSLMGEDRIDGKCHFGEKAIGLRSLLVFNPWFDPSRDTWKSCSLLRVLDLDFKTFYKPDESFYGIKCLIHLRYLGIKGGICRLKPSSIFDLQYIETLNLQFCSFDSSMVRNNMFYNMKRLRHLYLPREFGVEGSRKLKFPIEGQMETIKNFDPKSCETEDLMQMTNLRVFSITKDYIFRNAKELKRLLEAPVMKNAEQLFNNIRLEIAKDVINEEPTILSPVAGHPCFKGLTIEGQGEQVNKKGNTIIFPKSLTWVKLYRCAAIGDVLLDIEMLPCLKSLSIYSGQVGNKLLSFSDGSFPKLTELILSYQMELEEWEVRKGALANLQRLKLVRLKKLKKVVINELPNSLTQVEIEDCEVWNEGVSLLDWLEKLPRLQELTINRGGGNKLSFSNDSFPQLTKLQIKHSEWEKWEVGKGALANLQSLELAEWKRLKKVFMNELPDSLTRVEIKNCGEGGVSLLDWLEKLPCLQTLQIDSGGNIKFSSSPGSFPQLAKLTWHLELMEFEVGDRALPNLQQLRLQGCKKLNMLSNLPNSLTLVDLIECEIGEGVGGDLLLALENLPCLQQLGLRCTTGNKMRFSPGSFPQLRQLVIWAPKELEEWEVGDGALLTLQRLELVKLDKLKNLPEGLPISVHIVCMNPCIKGIEKYNTCPDFKESRWRLKPMRWLHDSCA